MAATSSARSSPCATAGAILEVRDESGATREFVLNPATARFLAAGSAQGERLELLDDG